MVANSKLAVAALGFACIAAAHAVDFKKLEEDFKKIIPGREQSKEEKSPDAKPAEPRVKDGKPPARAQQPTQKPSPQPDATADADEAKSDGFDPLALLAGVPVDKEVAIGRTISGNLLGAAPLVKDARLQQYVNRVGRWVAAQSERRDLPKWTFGVIDSSDVNAFAAPGGYVFITRGLYQRLRDEAELAGVLGHEVAHVQQKHHLKILQQSQLIAAGGEAFGRQLGKDEKSLQKLIGSGAEIMARSLDKSAEFEADRIGVVLAARAGYDPYGLPAVLQDMSEATTDDGSFALLFKTHPKPEERLSALDEAMGSRLDAIEEGNDLPERLYRLPRK